MSNKVRDVMLTLGTGSLIVLTTLFGMKQCSGDSCGKKCKEPVKKQKIEIVNNNKVIVDGGVEIDNNSVIIVDDSVKIENNNDVKVPSVKDDCGCKDTVVVIVKPQPKTQPKPQPKPKTVVNDTVRNKVVVNDTVRNKVVVNDTVSNVVPQDTVKSVKPSIAWGYACSIGSCNQR
jgi:hypothetical protein